MTTKRINCYRARSKRNARLSFSDRNDTRKKFGIPEIKKE